MEHNMHPLATVNPALSPLQGLLKIDQLAFIARNDNDIAGLKRELNRVSASK